MGTVKIGDVYTITDLFRDLKQVTVTDICGKQIQLRTKACFFYWDWIDDFCKNIVSNDGIDEFVVELKNLLKN